MGKNKELESMDVTEDFKVMIHLPVLLRPWPPALFSPWPSNSAVRVLDQCNTLHLPVTEKIHIIQAVY